MGIFDKILGSINTNEKITLAVVGIPHSGKSYLLSDIITSYRNMGYVEHRLEREGVPYRRISDFQANIAKKGSVSQTEVYPLRPGENIYGAKLVKKGGKTLELVFADIPGEVFNSNSGVKDLTNIKVYFRYCDQLRHCGQVFQVTTWKNDAGNELKVVEPVITNEEKKKSFEDQKESTEKIEDLLNGRKQSYLDWSYLYTWLKYNGYASVEQSTRKINGRELLQHFFEYQPDSLMRTLAYKVEIICPDLNIGAADFESNYLMPFYFLHYCYEASDIVACDKLIVPQDVHDNEDVAFNNYQVMMVELTEFIAEKTDSCHVYLAFRGVDFMIKEVAGNYKALYGNLRKVFPTNKLRNFVYSLFAYLLWNRVDETNVIEDNSSLVTHLGVEGIVDPETFALDELRGKYIDMNCGDGSINGQTANIENTLLGLIRAHIGQGPANNFYRLLSIAYHYAEPEEGIMRRMPPHIYFTCTPITQEFEIYVNDPENANQRFVNNNETGTMKYFDRAGSHFCFGTYQLCLDMLAQHGENIVDDYNLNNLLNRMINQG